MKLGVNAPRPIEMLVKANDIATTVASDNSAIAGLTSRMKLENSVSAPVSDADTAQHSQYFSQIIVSRLTGARPRIQNCLPSSESIG
ncbi:MAG: hypothetical protein BWZ10_01589 [candidate division BRC1 bacterium ADurb.BinA364]|nr:MAG: hypothetical protein BWZ10_01589 [candidate division BRC1 bacterium ADurb.BinA364]